MRNLLKKLNWGGGGSNYGTKEAYFPLAKALATANWEGEFHRLQDPPKIVESSVRQQK